MKPKPEQKPEEETIYRIRLTRTVADKLKAKAKLERRTLHNLMVVILEDSVGIQA